jgi:hypothetical protein
MRGEEERREEEKRKRRKRVKRVEDTIEIYRYRLS